MFEVSNEKLSVVDEDRRRLSEFGSNPYRREASVNLDLYEKFGKLRRNQPKDCRERMRIALLSILVQPKRGYAFFEDEQIVEFRATFLRYGLDAIKIRCDKARKSLLHIAVENGLVKITDFLISQGADIYDKDGDGKTSFEIVPLRNLRVIRQLLNKKKRELDLHERRLRLWGIVNFAIFRIQVGRRLRFGFLKPIGLPLFFRNLHIRN